MSSPQEFWDACLIKTWRKAGTVWDAVDMFEAITGLKFSDCKLLRAPLAGFPWQIGVRVFVAAYLSKISERLWEQPPEKDVLLLRKLTASTYDTTKANHAADADLAKERKAIRKNRAVMALRSHQRSERNRATDWSVTKGRAKVGRASR